MNKTIAAAFFILKPKKAEKGKEGKKNATYRNFASRQPEVVSRIQYLL